MSDPKLHQYVSVFMWKRLCSNEAEKLWDCEIIGELCMLITECEWEDILLPFKEILDSM